MFSQKNPRALLALLAVAPTLGLLTPQVRAGETYLFTINQAASSTTASATANAPFAGTLTGQNAPMAVPPAPTRVKRMVPGFPFPTCGTFTATTNELITISGAIAASGSSSSSSPIRPSGTFRLGIDTVAGTASISRLTTNLISTGSLSVAANLNNFTYQSFCAINPSCNAPFFVPISLPLGTIGVTSLTAVQDPGSVALGTLTPASGGAYTFSVPVSVTVTPTATFSGSPLTVDPQAVQITLTGTVTPGATATLSNTSTSVDTGLQTNNTPTVVPPTPFAVPDDSILCGGIDILVAITLSSTSFQSTSSVAIAGSGPRVPCACDHNANLSVDLLDIFSFLTAWFAADPSADFNGAGGVELLDIFSFLQCWFAPPPGC